MITIKNVLYKVLFKIAYEAAMLMVISVFV